MKAVTCETLQKIDKSAEESFSIPGLVLMEVAGYESYLFLKRHWEEYFDRPPLKVIFFVGSGNNGGDGLVMARHLSRQLLNWSHYFNHLVHLEIVTDLEKSSRSELNRRQLEIIRNLGVPIIDYRKYKKSLSSLKKFKRSRTNRGLGGNKNDVDVVVVDALLGIGAVSKPAHGSGADMIAMIHHLKSRTSNFVISLDIPSGVFYGLSDPEKISVVRADTTLTYGLHKDILYYPQAQPLAGDIHLLQPGFPPNLLDSAKSRFTIVDEHEVSMMISPFHKTDYKKSRGRIGVVAGKRGMLGAAYLTTEATWKAGAGLVTLFLPPADRNSLTRFLPHTMVYVHDDFNKYRDRSLSNDFDVMVFGPGLGRESDHLQEILIMILGQGMPVVIDADGIYYFKRLLDNHRSRQDRGNSRNNFFPVEHASVILTPHLGEMRHLLSGLDAPDPGVDPWGAVHAFFKYYRLTKTVVVLKCHLNYIISFVKIPSLVDPIVEGGNPLLGVGGSGDVLSGIIASVTARQIILGEKKKQEKIIHLLRGAVSGSYFHQEAGRQARDKVKIFTSKELIDYIPKVLSSFLSI